MTTLEDFGLEADDPEEEPPDPVPDPSPKRRYRNGRCPAISITKRRRCRSPVSRMNDADGFCAAHARQHSPWTIHDDPEELILIMGEIGHAATLGAVEQDAVDFDVELVRDAVEAVKRGGAL